MLLILLYMDKDIEAAMHCRRIDMALFRPKMTGTNIVLYSLYNLEMISKGYTSEAPLEVEFCIERVVEDG